jgi:hypothetical protein
VYNKIHHHFYGRDLILRASVLVRRGECAREEKGVYRNGRDGGGRKEFGEKWRGRTVSGEAEAGKDAG